MQDSMNDEFEMGEVVLDCFRDGHGENVVLRVMKIGRVRF